MTITDIKISQEINFNGMPTWISIGGTLLPDEDVLKSLKKVQKHITDYDNDAKKEFSKSKWDKPKLKNGEPVKSMIEEMEACTKFDDINSFRFTVKTDAEKLVYETKLNELKPKK